MTKNALIFGINCCAGSHLADLLLLEGYHVYGTKRHSSSTANIEHIKNLLDIYEIDLTEQVTIRKVLEESKPHFVFILISADHRQALDEAISINVKGTFTLFNALAEFEPQPEKVILISSSAVYGVYDNNLPINEKMQCRPIDPYGLVKILQEDVSMYYLNKFNVPVVIARSFNHPGPKEKQGLFCTDYAKRIVAIEKGRSFPVIELRSADNMRDLVDVRDVVKGYLGIAVQGEKGHIYNFCSGYPYKVRDVVQILVSLSTVEIELKERERDTDRKLNIQRGDYSKVKSEIGWRPSIPIEQTLKDLLTYQREKAGI